MASQLNGGIASLFLLEIPGKASLSAPHPGKRVLNAAKGDEALLRTFEGEMEFNQLPDRQ